MTAHRGRSALLAYASFSPTLTTAQRITHIRLVFGKNADENTILGQMKEALDLHQGHRINEAHQLLERMIADHLEGV